MLTGIFINVRCSKYTYFIWLNSSVRGPFLPSYVEHKIHWTRPFTERIDDSVKLVGSSISCGVSHEYPPEPHVQSYAVATDRVGLDVLKNSGRVFKCYKTMREVVYYSEMGASVAILDAGYNIDSLMLRYQGINWRKLRGYVLEFACNGAMNPLQPKFYDGIDIDPLEVMFVKVKDAFLEADWQSARRGERMSEWKKAAKKTPKEHAFLAAQSLWLDEKAEKAVERAERLTHSCFDWEFYIKANEKDLAYLRKEEHPPYAAWDQYVDMGLFEGRPHKWREEC